MLMLILYVGLNAHALTFFCLKITYEITLCTPCLKIMSSGWMLISYTSQQLLMRLSWLILGRNGGARQGGPLGEGCNNSFLSIM
jgi:hypothetical protein